MKPVQLLGLAFATAAFGGVVTLVSMGFFQQSRPVEPGELTGQQQALVVALIVAGVAFIVTLVGVALMLLAIDPAQVGKRVDRAVLLPEEGEDAAASRDAEGSGEQPPDDGTLRG